MSRISNDGFEETIQAGVDCYYAGQIPNGWENCAWDDAAIVKASRAPFVMGWYMASMYDNGMYS